MKAFIDPAVRAFIDVDTQFDFVFPAGALYTPGAEKVIPAVSALNRFASDNGIPLLSTMCAHGEDAEEFKVWPPHCVVGTVGQRKPASTLVPNQTIIEKDALDVFSNPDFVPLLDRLKVDECLVYGVLTEFCVKCAIMGLLQTGRRVSLAIDAIAHYNQADGEKVIADFVAAGGHCIDTHFSSPDGPYIPGTAVPNNRK